MNFFLFLYSSQQIIDEVRMKIAVHYPLADKYYELQSVLCLNDFAQLWKMKFYLIKGFARVIDKISHLLNGNEIILMELMSLFSLFDEESISICTQMSHSSQASNSSR